MNWCVAVRRDSSEIDKAMQEAATLGRELAAALPHGESAPGHPWVLLMFRPIPRGVPAVVTATLVDRNGYPQ